MAMRIYLINLERRPDRLAAMTARAEGLGSALERVEAVDASTLEPATVNRWFENGGPLGEIPHGNKAYLLSHRLAWQKFMSSSFSHAKNQKKKKQQTPQTNTQQTDENW